MVNGFFTSFFGPKRWIRKIGRRWKKVRRAKRKEAKEGEERELIEKRKRFSSLFSEAIGPLDFSALTIVIPTHERSGYLRRAIEFYEEWDCRVLIADSSAERFSGEVPESFDYVHFPESPYGAKMKEIIGQVATPYVLLAADDDFISPFGATSALEAISSDPEISSVQGWHSGFSRWKTAVNWSALHLFAKEYAIDGETPRQRIDQLTSLYLNNFYALHRTDVFSHFFGTVAPELEDELQGRPDLFEIAQAVTTVHWGRHLVLPQLWIGREMIADSEGFKSTTDWSDGDEGAQKLFQSLGSILFPDTPEETLEQAYSKFVVYQNNWDGGEIPHGGNIEEVESGKEDLTFRYRMEGLILKHMV
ncbi:MAG: TIGR00180 family glycosyltransferase [Verrucomicrobiota bacterium]